MASKIFSKYKFKILDLLLKIYKFLAEDGIGLLRFLDCIVIAVISKTPGSGKFPSLSKGIKVLRKLDSSKNSVSKFLFFVNRQ